MVDYIHQWAVGNRLELTNCNKAFLIQNAGHELFCLTNSIGMSFIQNELRYN